MNTRLLTILGIVLVAGGILVTSSFFIVGQTEQALVLQLGEVRRVVREPGLKIKRPFIEDVIIYDKRVLDFEPPHEEVIVADQKRLVVDAYTRYRIVNPLLFYQTVGTEQGVRARLSALVTGSLRRVLGGVTLNDILSTRRSAIMHQIRDDVAAQARGFGIEVVDVRLRRADLPEENSQAIYARMQSEREREARQYRSEGAEAAQNVRANADRERTIILADAQRDAQRVRGDGDAQAVRIYGEAFGRDQQFFTFYRSLQAYREALNGRDTAFVLSPDGHFFRYFNGSAPGMATAGAVMPPGIAPPATATADAATPPQGVPMARAEAVPLPAPAAGSSPEPASPGVTAAPVAAVGGPVSTDTLPDAPRAP
jgi:membrane protease subunit HflC